MSVIVENLTKTFDKVNAIEDISFNVAKGEILGFLGSNGAGKTTTMKILSCFIPQTSGTAKVCDYDVMKQPEEVKKRIGYLPEHNPLYGHMYITEFLNFVAGIHKIENSNGRIEEIIELTGLKSELGKKISELSKGYKQRVGLAQAMIHDPEVLILDEPTSGLDPNQLKEMRALIKRLGKEKTVIFSSHIMQEIEAVCDRVIIIHKGEIKYNKALHNGASDHLATWIVSVNKAIAMKLITALPGVDAVEKLNDKSFKISCHDEKAMKKAMTSLLADKGGFISEMYQLKDDLEDIFLKYTED